MRLWLGSLVIGKLVPRAYAQLVFQIVHDDGAVAFFVLMPLKKMRVLIIGTSKQLLSACFNAGVMALLDDGIPLRYMDAAVEFQTSRADPDLFTHTFASDTSLLPSSSTVDARHTICYEPSAGENGLLGVHSEGPFTPQHVAIFFIFVFVASVPCQEHRTLRRADRL